jgi:hypothetical protein
MIVRRLMLAAVALLCATAGALALASAPAFAVIQHAYLSQLAESPSGPRSESEEPVCGVTVDPATQDVYVAEPANDAVDVFSAAGRYEFQISGMGVPSGSFSPVQTCSVAVSDVTHDVYVADSIAEVVYVFNALGAYIKTIAGDPKGDFEGNIKVAVDNSSGASRGDVYIVGESSKAVDRFNAANEYQSTFAEGRDALDLAVGLSGDIYLAEISGNGSNPSYGVSELSSAGVEVAHISGTPSGAFRYLHGIAIDSEGNVYVSSSSVVYEFDSAGVFVSEVLGTSPDSSFVVGDGGAIGDGVAVNASGDLYVTVRPEKPEVEAGAPGVVDEFGPGVDVPFVLTGAVSGVSDSGATVAGVVNPEGVEVTSCEFEYVLHSAYQAAVAVKKFNPYEGGSVAACSPSPVGSSGVAELAVSAGLSGLAQSTAYDFRIVAANKDGPNYYGGDGTFKTNGPPVIEGQSVLSVAQTGASIKAEVNPDGYDTSVFVEYGESEGYGSHSAPVDVGSGTAGQSAVLALEGLKAGSLYHYRVVAENQVSKEEDAPVEGPDGTLETSPPVRIGGESVARVGSYTASVIAQLNDFGTSSTYYVEYGKGASYGSVTPVTNLPAGGENVAVSVEVSGLLPETVYHARLVASNALGSRNGPDVAFRTFTASSSGLPDGRMYELVSAVGGSAEVYVPQGMTFGNLNRVGAHGLSSDYPFEAASDGDALVYVGTQSATTGGNGNVVIGAGEELLASRSATGSWTQSDLEKPQSEAYDAFSEDLSVGVYHDSGEQLAADAPLGYDDLYTHLLVDGPYEPLLTVPPEGRTAKEFGHVQNGVVEQGMGFAGANAGTNAVPAFSHVLFEANAQMVSTPEAPSVSVDENNLYDSVGGRLYLVNVLPNGRTQPRATFGRDGPGDNGFAAPVRGGVISAQGSRVFWSAVQPAANEGEEETPLALYVRENDTRPQSEVEEGHCTESGLACTVQVDASVLPGTTKEKEEDGGFGAFLTASEDGSRVFFTDEKPLTADSTSAPGKPDLYEYNLEGPEGERLTDLSVPVANAACSRPPGVCGHGDVEGLLGTSRDGSYVYFVAGGVLSEGKNAQGEEPAWGEPNLYLRHEGRTVFVTTLSDADDAFVTYPTQEGDWQTPLGRRTAEVTPNGQSVVFMSRRELTGYDNVLDGVSLMEVFVYDASTGRLACASCNPSGEGPVASSVPEFASSIQETHGSRLPTSGSLAGYQPRVISEDGLRVFFDSLEPLVPQDSNGYLDVYEWEAPGEGSCTAQTASSVTGGCVYLLSGGQDSENSYLVDASANGSDVFFASRAQLSRSARGEVDEIFDARVDGVPPPEEVHCSGTTCQGVPPAPPVFATPSSETFSGIGNFPHGASTSRQTVVKPKPKPTKCKKGLTKNKKDRCVRRLKAKKRDKKANRRAG